MSAGSLEICCPACGKESLLRKEPVYDGLKKTGETLSCSSCGHVFESEDDVVYKQAGSQKVFSDADKSVAPKLFEEGENRILCRYCTHYVVNPFVQRCSLHAKPVEATDTCDRFEPKPDEEEEEEQPEQDERSAKLRKLLGDD